MTQRKSRITIAALASLSVVVALLVANVALSGTPNVGVMWSPTAVNATAEPGSQQSFPVTLTALTDLSGAVITVVPELRGIVSVSPTSFATLRAGRSVTLRLAVIPSAREPLRTVQGTIHIEVGSSTVARPLPVTISLVAADIINGIKVPPDPGAAGNSTIAGIDSDGNGIRDDIDRFIATKYGTNPAALKAAQLSARARQRVLTVDATNQAAARVALQDSGDAGVCAGISFRTAGLSSSQELEELYLRIYNTPERLAQQKAVSASAGQFTRSVTDVVCP